MCSGSGGGGGVCSFVIFSEIESKSSSNLADPRALSSSESFDGSAPIVPASITKTSPTDQDAHGDSVDRSPIVSWNLIFF